MIVAIFASALFVLLVVGLFFAFSGDESTSTPTLTISPNQGPSGTEATITVTNAEPNANVTINYQSGGTVTGRTDANGAFTDPNAYTFTGQPGETIRVDVFVGNGTDVRASATFTITGGTESSAPASTTTVPDAPPPLSATVTLTPSNGPSGTSSQITVTGKPNSPVTLTIGGNAHTGGATDANGTWTYRYTFFGRDGERIPVDAIVGQSGDESKASAEFEIKEGTISGGPWTFRSMFVVGLDNARHAGPIGMPAELDLKVQVNTITITGPAPFVAVTGDLADDGSFSIAGVGTVAGFPDVDVSFEGTVSTTGLTGSYTMGTGGELPQGEPIVYEVESNSVLPPPPDFAAFYQLLSESLATGDDFAIESLHPAVFDRYGSDQCAAYLGTITNPGVTLSFVQFVDVVDYDYPTDGLTTPIGLAFLVEVELTNAGSPSTIQANVVGTPSGKALWFTDCGDPTV